MVQAELGGSGNRSGEGSPDHPGDPGNRHGLPVACLELGVFPFGPGWRVALREVEQLRPGVDGRAAAREIAGNGRCRLEPVAPRKVGIVDGRPRPYGISSEAELVDLGPDRMEWPVEVLCDFLQMNVIVKPAFEIIDLVRSPRVCSEGHFAQGGPCSFVIGCGYGDKFDNCEAVRRGRRDRHGCSSGAVGRSGGRCGFRRDGSFRWRRLRTACRARR
jgi:hypothetical protein